MKTSNKSNAIIAYVAVALFAFSFIGLLILNHSKQKTEQALNESKLNAETLLSEKLSVEKQIGQLKNDLRELNGKNADLDRILNETSKKLAQKEAEFQSALNSSNVKRRSLENQIAQLQRIKEDLERERDLMSQNLDQLKGSNKDLNDLIASLQAKNRKYEEDMSLQKALADNFRIESLKGKKDKLTVNSRRTKKLTVGFDVPQALTEDVNFKVITPQGKEFASNDGKSKEISLRIIESDAGLVASLSPVTGDFEISKRIEMTYKPKEKLKSGVYKIQVYNGDTYLGSCQMRLK